MTGPKISVFAAAILCIAIGCRDRSNHDAANAGPEQAGFEQADEHVNRWEYVEDFDTEIAIFDTVFWEPRDTESLRQLIRETPLVQDKTVLEIGTGSGLISLCCLRAGARKVIATDVNPSAIDNAKYNVRQLGLPEKRFEARLVPLNNSGAYSVIAADERFDLVISNPPWEDEFPQSIDQYALYDPNFELLVSLLGGLREHLSPNGRALLAYGCVTAIKTLYRLADEQGLHVLSLDERELDSLPEVFLSGMLLEVSVNQ